jgi:hypothetical protein
VPQSGQNFAVAVSDVPQREQPDSSLVPQDTQNVAPDADNILQLEQVTSGCEAEVLTE